MPTASESLHSKVLAALDRERWFNLLRPVLRGYFVALAFDIPLPISRAPLENTVP